MSDAYMWSSLTHMPQIDTNWATTTRQPQSDLDRDAFLNLLITQLRHQDPLNPMDDSQFIAQMAQFSTLEQMVQLNNTFERTQAFGMIGKIIDADFFCEVREEWVEIDSRLVTSVTRQGDRVFLTVMGEDGPVDVPFDSVREVSEDFLVSQQLYEIFATVHGQRATELIGKWVQAVTIQGDTATFVEGRVDSVKLNGSQAVLVVGNREVFMHEVFAVSDDYMLINSPHFTHGDILTGVEIANNRAYLIFDNNPAERVRIQRINHATEALIFVGNPISFGAISGTVDNITIRGGVPFLNVYRNEVGDDGETRRVRAGQINFLDYLIERTGGEPDPGTGTGDSNTSSTPGTGNNTNTTPDPDTQPDDDPDTDGDDT